MNKHELNLLAQSLSTSPIEEVARLLGENARLRAEQSQLKLLLREARNYVLSRHCAKEALDLRNRIDATLGEGEK